MSIIIEENEKEHFDKASVNNITIYKIKAYTPITDFVENSNIDYEYENKKSLIDWLKLYLDLYLKSPHSKSSQNKQLAGRLYEELDAINNQAQLPENYSAISLDGIRNVFKKIEKKVAPYGFWNKKESYLLNFALEGQKAINEFQRSQSRYLDHLKMCNLLRKNELIPGLQEASTKYADETTTIIFQNKTHEKTIAEQQEEIDTLKKELEALKASPASTAVKESFTQTKDIQETPKPKLEDLKNMEQTIDQIDNAINSSQITQLVQQAEASKTDDLKVEVTHNKLRRKRSNSVSPSRHDALKNQLETANDRVKQLEQQLEAKDKEISLLRKVLKAIFNLISTDTNYNKDKSFTEAGQVLISENLVLNSKRAESKSGNLTWLSWNKSNDSAIPKTPSVSVPETPKCSK